MAPRSYQGSVLADTYRLESRIGKGGMGVVYRASHTRLPRQFAIKILNANLAEDDEQLRRFQSEAEIACSVGDKQVVEVFDFNRTPDGLAYIVMELLEGKDLAARILEAGHLGLSETATILDQMADALEATHSRGVIHRDLKPPNIFLCRQDKGRDLVKLLDFGLAKLQEGSPRTKTGMVFGSPAYMAPEQAMTGLAEVTQQADVWATGVILYECLTGQLPFVGETVQDTLGAICDKDPRPLRQIRSEIPEPVEAVVLKALEKKLDKRFAGVRNLRDAFTEACEKSWNRNVRNSKGVEQLHSFDENETRPFAEEESLTSEMDPALASTLAPPMQPTVEEEEPTLLQETFDKGETDTTLPRHLAPPSSKPLATGGVSKRTKYLLGGGILLGAALALAILTTSGSGETPKEKGPAAAGARAADTPSHTETIVKPRAAAANGDVPTTSPSPATLPPNLDKVEAKPVDGNPDVVKSSPPEPATTSPGGSTVKTRNTAKARKAGQETKRKARKTVPEKLKKPKEAKPKDVKTWDRNSLELPGG